MNLHEYQGKDILADFGVGVQRGLVANNKAEAVDGKKIKDRYIMVCR